MATAIVVNADIGAGPAIRARLLGDGFVVHAIDNAAADRSSVGGAVARIGADYGVDLLVNNAPRFEVRNALDMSAASFSSLLGSGLHGVFSSCREAARCAAESGTELVIVNVISTLAVVGLAGRMGEACVSAGVFAATKALAAEWGPLGIRVTAVMVGPTGSWLPASGSIDAVPGVIPLQRVVSDDEVAGAVAMLAGADAAGVTGQALIVDAGWLANGWRRE